MGYDTDKLNDTGAASATARERGGMMTGLFKDRESAEGAYSSLSSRGYGKDDVNLMMSDETRKKYFTDDDSELGQRHGKTPARVRRSAAASARR